MMGIEDKLIILSTEDILNESSTEDKFNKLKETMSSTLRTPHASVKARPCGLQWNAEHSEGVGESE